jgi:molecular chaperone DnaK (HSP70)
MAKYLAYAGEHGLDKATGKVECTFRQSKLHVGRQGFDLRMVHPAMKASLSKFPEVTPEVVLAHIMRYMKEQLEKELRAKSTEFASYSCENLTITVPANWNPEQRRATAFAAKLAGFKGDAELLEEPVSALIALREKNNFGLSKDRENVMVIDFGGGTCDICLLGVKERHIDLLDTRAAHIGGESIDGLLFSEYLDSIQNGQHQIPEDIVLNILSEIEAFKIKLSNAMTMRLAQDPENYQGYIKRTFRFTGQASHRFSGFSQTEDSELTISYQTFDDRLAEMRTAFTELLKVARSVADGQGGTQKLFVVGGSSQLYFVRPVIQSIFQELEWGRSIQRPNLPELYVAQGAAWYQQARVRRKDIFDHRIFYGIGLEIPQENRIEPFVSEGSKLPCKRSKPIMLREEAVPTDKLTLRFQRDDLVAQGPIEKDILANRKITPADRLRIFVQVRRDGIVDIVAKDQRGNKPPLELETQESYPLGSKFEKVSRSLTIPFPFIRDSKRRE